MMKALGVLAAATCVMSAPAVSERDVSATATVSVDGLSFSGNVTLADSNQFKFRETLFTDLLIVPAAIYSSIGIEAESNSNSGSVEVDVIYGLIYFPSLLLKFPPTSWMAYYSASGSGVSAPSGLEVSVTGAASLVATVYTGFKEIDSTGAVVATVDFKNLIWSIKERKTSSDGLLRYYTFGATSGKATIEVTVAASKVVGKLNVGGATITPQSLETIVEISSYPYKAATNHIDLIMISGQASASAAVSYSSTHTLIAGSGDSQVYVKFNGEAVVDGKTVDVKVSGYSDANIDLSEIDNSYLEAQLQANGDLKTSVRKITVSFPANSASISYDPSMGVKAPNSSAAIIPVLVSVIFAVLFAIVM